MLQKPLFKEFAVLTFIIGTVHFLALKDSWYWLYDQFDVPMHFFGGALIGLFFLWFYFYSDLFAPQIRTRKQFLFFSLLGVLIVALLWEAFELSGGITSLAQPGYGADTTKDFIMDFLGAIVVALYGFSREKKLQLLALQEQKLPEQTPELLWHV